MRKIEIIVSPNGETKLETKGWTGSSCEEASRFLEEALGVEQHNEKTAAFYERMAANQRSCERS